MQTRPSKMLINRPIFTNGGTISVSAFYHPVFPFCHPERSRGISDVPARDPSTSLGMTERGSRDDGKKSGDLRGESNAGSSCLLSDPLRLNGRFSSYTCAIGTGFSIPRWRAPCGGNASGPTGGNLGGVVNRTVSWGPTTSAVFWPRPDTVLPSI